MFLNNTFHSLLLLEGCVLTIAAIGTLSAQQDIPDRKQIYDRRFVEQLRNAKTLEEPQVSISSRDFQELIIDDEDVDQTTAVLGKYKKKMEGLLCADALIVLHGFRYKKPKSLGRPKSSALSVVLEKSKSFFKNDLLRRVGELRAFMALMISVFYTGRVGLPKWFWTIYTKLSNSDVGKGDGEFFHYLSPLAHEVCMFCKKCQTYNYIPKTDDYDPLTLSHPDKTSTTEAFIRNLTAHLWETFEVDPIAGNAGLFELNTIRLVHLNKKDDWFFENPSRPIWQNAKDKFTRLRVRYFAVHTTDWVQQPDYEYHELIMEVVGANVLFYTWSHLKVFWKNVEEFANGSDGDYTANMTDGIKSKMHEFWLLLKDPLELAVKFLGVHDGPLWILWNLIDPDKMVDYKDLKRIAVQIEVMFNRSRNVLTAFGHVDTSRKITATTDLSIPHDDRNAPHLMDLYLNLVTIGLKPVNFYYVKFVAIGNTNRLPLYIS